ncbi:MAG: type IV pilus secretin PilQ [Deltaproteobacteria bacterium]
MRMSGKRLRRLLLPLAVSGLFAVGGCATTGDKATKESPVDIVELKGDGEPAQTLVEYINVVGDGDRIIIRTTGPVKYTIFKLTDPDRLIVDIPQVNLDKIEPSMDINNDYIRSITVSNYGDDKDIGRIVVGLRQGVEHEVKSGENSVLINLSGAKVSSEPAEVSSPAVDVPEAALAAPVEADIAPPAPVVATPDEPRQAKAILGVSSTRQGADMVIKAVADGIIGNYNSFEMESPARLAVDVWGVANSTGIKDEKVADRIVKGIRIGEHEDKTRLVIDTTLKKLPAYSIKKAGDTLVVTFGPGALKAAEETKEEAKKEVEPPVAATPVSVPVAAPEAPVSEPAKQKSVEVLRVEFKRIDAVGRLIIAVSEKRAFEVKESTDKSTVIFDIKDASISKELSRTLDATRLKTPVASISSYQDGEEEGGNVRVLVRLMEKAQYRLKEENGVIMADFTRIEAPTEAKQAVSKAAEAPLQAAKEEPSASGEEAKKIYSGKKIDLDMTDANITDVIRLLAEVSNLNIIASDDVKGVITLRLKNVPWDQAFEIILKSKDLDSIQEGNVVRVAPITKIRQERETLLASKKAREKLEDLDVKYVPVNYATASDMEKQVKSVLTDRGTVTSDIRTNTLIIKDIKLGIDAAIDLVKRLDTAIPQVLIEARIVEASSTFARDLGIQWGVDYSTGGSTTTQTYGGLQEAGVVDPGGTTSASRSYAINLPATGTAGTLGALGFTIGTAGQNPLLLDLRLSMGESEKRLKTISRPRITTLDNKEAKIEQGESIPFETSSASGTSTTFVDANLSLTVVPHITPDGSVLMKISAKRNAIGSFETGSGQPSINKKEAITEVLVRDGETTVIGGIVISDKSNSEQGIPYLQDIPLIGNIFKSKSVLDSQQELLIFITPTILREKPAI